MIVGGSRFRPTFLFCSTDSIKSLFWISAHHVDKDTVKRVVFRIRTFSENKGLLSFRQKALSASSASLVQRVQSATPACTVSHFIYCLYFNTDVRLLPNLPLTLGHYHETARPHRGHDRRRHRPDRSARQTPHKVLRMHKERGARRRDRIGLPGQARGAQADRPRGEEGRPDRPIGVLLHRGSARGVGGIREKASRCAGFDVYNFLLFPAGRKPAKKRRHPRKEEADYRKI